MLSSNWDNVADVSKTNIMDSISVHYDLQMDDQSVASYVRKCFTKAYAQWKYELHKYYNLFESANDALTHPPSEMSARLDEWQWLCTHFGCPKFLNKSKANLSNRKVPSRIEHHGGSMPFSYRVESHRQAGSQFPEIDNYQDVYARPGNDAAIALHAEMEAKKAAYLEEMVSQTAPDSIPVPDPDAGLRILTETLGVRRGKEIRGTGAGRVHDLRAGSSSQPSAPEYLNLSNEVQELKRQLEASRHENQTLVRQMMDQLASLVPGFVRPGSTDESMPDSSHGGDHE